MNHSTFSALEYPKVVDWLAGLTAFSAGRERVLALQPSERREEVERALGGTAEALALLDARPGLGLGGVRDIRPAVGRAALGGTLNTDELHAIGDTAAAGDRWQSALARSAEAYPVLWDLVEPLDAHRGLRYAISTAIGEDGQVLDAASEDLARIRQALRAAHDRLLRRLQEMLGSATIRQALQEPIVTQRDGRYVLPVKSEARGQVKGIVHDQSASGATVFVEPLEIVELSNRWRQFERDEAAEIERILRALSQFVASEGDGLRRTLAALAEIDLHQAKARLARLLDATRPALAVPTARGGQPPLLLRDARHPLLERTLGRPNVVPTTLELGGEFDMLLITGPNTGGKTVALKTLGLLVLMAQAGLFVPAAEGSVVPVFDGVYADIGDEQSIEQSLSTFSSHVSRIVDMLRWADARSLVLLDELGAGTDPEEGAALARSILDELRGRGALCVATTHYSELKAYAHATPRVENASVEFDVESLAPTYRLRIGLPGRSNALAIATRIGMPRDIVERAGEALQPQQREIAGMIAQLEADREAAEAARGEAERLRRDAEIYRDRLQRTYHEAEAERARAFDEARTESEGLLADLRREIQDLRRRAERAGRDTAAVADIAERSRSLAPVLPPRPLRRPESEQPEPEARPLRVGQEVFVPTLGVNGTVLSIDRDGNAEVGVGGMRVQLRPADLRGAGAARPERRREPAARPVTFEAPTRYVPQELDVRGKRREEATEEVDRYIHDAFMAGLPRVRIIHGRGTGVVRSAVRDLLGGHRLVKEYQSADRTEGGEGATVVALAV